MGKNATAFSTGCNQHQFLFVSNVSCNFSIKPKPKIFNGMPYPNFPKKITSYVPAHLPDNTPTDETDFQIGFAQYNANNLPNVIYDFYFFPESFAHRKNPKFGQKLNASGNIMYEQYPRPGITPRVLFDFPIPGNINKISTTVPWWFLEIFYRLDGKIGWDDFEMRMEYTGDKCR